MQRIPEPELMNEFELARLAACGLDGLEVRTVTDSHLDVAGRLPE